MVDNKMNRKLQSENLYNLIREHRNMKTWKANFVFIKENYDYL